MMVGPLIYLLCVMVVVLVITAIPFIFAVIGIAIAAIAKWKAVKHIADTASETLTGKQNFELYPVTLPADSIPTSARNRLNMVAVVQLVRASDCGSECRGFESHLPPARKEENRQRFSSFSICNIAIYAHGDGNGVKTMSMKNALQVAF